MAPNQTNSSIDSGLESASDNDQIPITHVLIAVIARRRIIVRATLAGLVVGVLLALLLPSLYSSTASLMPPESSTISPQSVLSELNGPTLSLGGAGLTSQRTPGSTVIGILKSRTEQDALIDQFDLRHVYDVSTYESARTRLIDRCAYEEDKKSGIVTITVLDRDKARAQQIAQAHVDILNRLLSEVNTGAARRERAFLEVRLQGLKEQVQETSNELSKFSSTNATLNPASQGEALIGSESRLQSQLDTAQADLAGLLATYSDDNTLVKSARARVAALSADLRKMGAPGSASSPGDSGPTPSMRQLPLVAVKYSELFRRLAVQQAVYEALTKQYELAKVQEAKELPAAKELDKPALAEKRSSPQRGLLIAGCTIGASMLTILSVAITTVYGNFEEKHRIAALVKRMLREQHAEAHSESLS